MMITVYTTFLPTTTVHVSRLENADILLSSRDISDSPISTILHASLLLCERCVTFCNSVFVCFSLRLPISSKFFPCLNYFILSYLIMYITNNQPLSGFLCEPLRHCLLPARLPAEQTAGILFTYMSIFRSFPPCKGDNLHQCGDTWDQETKFYGLRYPYVRHMSEFSLNGLAYRAGFLYKDNPPIIPHCVITEFDYFQKRRLWNVYLPNAVSIPPPNMP